MEYARLGFFFAPSYLHFKALAVRIRVRSSSRRQIRDDRASAEQLRQLTFAPWLQLSVVFQGSLFCETVRVRKFDFQTDSTLSTRNPPMLLRIPRVFFLVLFLLVSSADLTLATNNPINGSAPVAFWSLALEEVTTIPNIGGNAPRMEQLVSGGEADMAYVIAQQGRIYSLDTTQQNPTAQLYLDVDAALTAVGATLNVANQTGVRGLAFHPDFNNSGTDGYRKLYTAHSRNALSGPLIGSPSPVVFPAPGGINHDSMVAEWTVNANGTVDTTSYRELLLVGQPAGDHNIGQIGFNPTATPGSSDYGKLYIALGDGGGPGDPQGLAQDITNNPHGSILRIDPIATATEPYTIPGDNPFAGQANRVEEIWAYGLRNPHKFGWDPLTGSMYISDIGQGVIEEINIGQSGANYGWDAREGSFVYDNTSNVSTLPGGHPSDSFTYPVAQYDHLFSNGIIGSSAITGASVYRGDDVPELTGMYLFADFASNPNPIFAVDADDLIERDDFTNVTSLDDGRLAPYVEVQINDGGILKDLREFIGDANSTSFGRTDMRWGLGPAGEIYILNKRDGVVRRIVGVSGLAAGDANRDGSVDGDDLALLRVDYGNSGDWSQGNFDASALVDGADFLKWQRNFGSTAVTSGSTVPEPATRVMLLVALQVLLARSPRKK